MGTSHFKEINLLVTEIWDFCIKNNIWITVAHIPGKHNVIAGFESRRGTNDTEWALQFYNLLKLRTYIDYLQK
jgi:hypothetical protein